MKSFSMSWSSSRGWSDNGDNLSEAQLVLAFGTRQWMVDSSAIAGLKQRFPKARMIGCSTGGQIVADDVSDDVASAIVMQFSNTELSVAQVRVAGEGGSFQAGQDLAKQLARSDLKGIFVLCDGLLVNGSQLVAGLRSMLAGNVVITGGLAGDGAAFEQTLVHVDGVNHKGLAVAIGFYGTAIRIGHGSAGGWSEFGPKRIITRSTGNILYDLDNKSALSLYKAYLGEEAQGLPGTGLLYPLMISDPSHPGHALVRTILAVDETRQTMTFAGDMPEGWSAQLMRGHFDLLALAAKSAAEQALTRLNVSGGEMAAILISCIGRRILMGENIVSEVVAARKSLGECTTMTGFYSYGEISPNAQCGYSELHNQTMTVTTFSECL